MTSEQNHFGFGDNINIHGDAVFASIRRYPTLLAEIINELGGRLFTLTENTPLTFNTFDIEEKISYNKIIRYRDVIDQYKVYQGKLSSIYKEIEDHGSLSKHILLENIRTLYFKVKGEYINNYTASDCHSIISDNSDNIIQAIEEELNRIVEKSDNINVPLEIIRFGVLVILVDAFMRCKILEEPA